MEPGNTPHLTDIRELAGLSDSQRQRLIDHGIAFVETFLAAARDDAARLAALLSCSDEEIDALHQQAEQLVAINFADSEAPPIPPFGLLPPSERHVRGVSDEPPGEEREK